MNYSVVGKSIPRIEVVQKVTGETKFAEDLNFPGMLYGKLLTSPYPHARILKIDRSKAEKLPGVHAVVCGEDIPLVRWGPLVRDQTVFARGKVRFIGDIVAAVAAETPQIAEEAVQLIEVDYEELPAVFDPLEAMKDGAVEIHEELDEYDCLLLGEPMKGNINRHAVFAKGDVEKGFAESDLVIEETFRTSVQYQAYLETRQAIAMVDSSGKLTVYVPSQMPHVIAIHLGEMFQMPLSKIRLISPEVGGGFGGKVETMVEPYAAALAMATKGRPVKLVLSRAEDMQIGNPRRGSTSTIKLGFKKDGTLHAFKSTVVLDGGAFAHEGPGIALHCAVKIVSPYRCPNARSETYNVYTNKIIYGPMRGFGNPQATWPREQMMDIAAHKLGISPADIRAMNFLKAGDTLVTGQVVQSVDVAECLEAVRKAIKLDEPSQGKNRAKGVAAMEHISGHNAACAFVKINADGSVNVMCGSSSLGCGQGTVIAQIVAEVLGIDVDKISVTLSDTEVTPFDYGNIATRGTYFTGNAALLAAEDAKRQLFETVASEFGVDADDLEAKDGRIMVKGKPEKSVTVGDVSYARHYYQRGPILGRGSFFGLLPKSDPEKPFGKQPPVPGMGPPLTYAVQAVELEVDPETGVVTPLKFAAGHGVGKAINPNAVEGQIEGGVAQGIGYGLFEAIEFDNGKVINPSFVDYRLPTTMDVPEIECLIVEKPIPTGPFGAKGLGELCLAPAAPAIANAIYNAIGVRVKEQPITPERILKALDLIDK